MISKNMFCSKTVWKQRTFNLYMSTVRKHKRDDLSSNHVTYDYKIRHSPISSYLRPSRNHSISFSWLVSTEVSDSHLFLSLQFSPTQNVPALAEERHAHCLVTEHFTFAVSRCSAGCGGLTRGSGHPGTERVCINTTLLFKTICMLGSRQRPPSLWLTGGEMVIRKFSPPAKEHSHDSSQVTTRPASLMRHVCHSSRSLLKHMM